MIKLTQHVIYAVDGSKGSSKRFRCWITEVLACTFHQTVKVFYLMQHTTPGGQTHQRPLNETALRLGV